jgi:pyrroline-5-carboxylate reductase
MLIGAVKVHSRDLRFDPTMPTSVSVTFIGGGNATRSLVGGLIARGQDAASIHVSAPSRETRAALAGDFGVHAHADNIEAAGHGAVWVFAVKPQIMRGVCEALSGAAQARRPLIISIAAGITCRQLQAWLGDGLAIVRAMPNTPAQLGAGAIGLFANAHVSAEQRRLADSLLQATGLTAWIDAEAQMDVVTALSGSGPAYVFLLAEAMQAAAIARGLPADTAHALTVQTVFGAARMLQESSEPAALLRQRVTSPGGTTRAAQDVFDAGDFQGLVDAAIAAATHRGRELSAAND